MFFADSTGRYASNFLAFRGGCTYREGQARSVVESKNSKNKADPFRGKSASEFARNSYLLNENLLIYLFCYGSKSTANLGRLHASVHFDIRRIFEKKLEHFAQHSPWRAAAMFVPVIYVLLCTIFRPAYETNDDAVMNLFAAGKGLALSPEEHLVFTHPAIGLMLRFLYSYVPSLPWYGLYLLSTQVVAHTIVAGVLLSYRRLRIASIWFAVWIATVGLYCIVRLQFTSTSFLAGMSGILLLLEVARAVCMKHQSIQTSPSGTIADSTLANNDLQKRLPIKRMLIAGIGLLLWSTMIRWFMFEMLIVLPLPVIAAWWYFQRPGWKNTGEAIAVYATIVLGGWSLKQAHYACYNADPEWRGFYEYNELRAMFNDSCQVYYSPETKEAFDKAGWSANDFTMMMSWCYDDPQTYSSEKLLEIYQSRISGAKDPYLGWFQT